MGFQNNDRQGCFDSTANSSNQPLDDKFEEALNNAYNGHVDFWKNEHPDGKFEHDNFKEGFTIAWKDADAFAQFDGSRIGRKEAWKRSRLQEFASSKGKLDFLWEWEQGFDQGLEGFYSAST